MTMKRETGALTGGVFAAYQFDADPRVAGWIAWQVCDSGLAWEEYLPLVDGKVRVWLDAKDQKQDIFIASVVREAADRFGFYSIGQVNIVTRGLTGTAFL